MLLPFQHDGQTVIFMLIVQLNRGNILYPRIVGRVMKVHIHYYHGSPALLSVASMVSLE